jgi:pyridoxal phosphate enzyme (YggS family)
VNLAAVRNAIADAARRSGRAPDAVTLVAVSKLQPASKLREAYAAGQRVFGENYVQEALGKIAEMPTDAVWHLIGHLQSNKAKQVPGRFEWIETVDTVKLAEALDRHAAAQGAEMRALVQVNWSGEATKSGLQDADALRALVEAMAGLDQVRLRGLMTIPDPQWDEARLRRCFAEMRRLREDLAAEFGLQDRLTELSMGMSHDYAWAIEEGATMVRVGTAIFGERP